MKTDLNIDNLTLQRGKHKTREQGMCALEAVAWLAGEKHSDAPGCVCLVIAAFLRCWNDDLPIHKRNELLRPYLKRVIGTAGDPEAPERRAWMAVDWLARECAPAFLRLNPKLQKHAEKLFALPPVLSERAWFAAEPVVEDAEAAAWEMARNAVGVAAWDAIRSAAWDATRFAAGDAAGDAARGTAVDTAVDAARNTAWAAAAAAIGNGLTPVVEDLQRSAQRLLDRMIDA